MNKNKHYAHVYDDVNCDIKFYLFNGIGTITVPTDSIIEGCVDTWYTVEMRTPAGRKLYDVHLYREDPFDQIDVLLYPIVVNSEGIAETDTTVCFKMEQTII